MRLFPSGSTAGGMPPDSRSFLLARAVQLFAPGVPQVYYVGVLAEAPPTPPTPVGALGANR